MELIFIGKDFYEDSKLLMSFMYTAEGHRADWGLVQRALQKGQDVHIRQATEKEKILYALKLQAYA